MTDFFICLFFICETDFMNSVNYVIYLNYIYIDDINIHNRNMHVLILVFYFNTY